MRDVRRVNQMLRAEHAHRDGKEQTSERQNLVETVFLRQLVLDDPVKPIAKITIAAKYSQNTSAGIPKATSVAAKSAWRKNCKLPLNICILGAPLRDSEPQSA